MIITTTNSVEGYQITEYLRVVSGETVFGMNVVRDIGASLRDLFGGRSKGYEDEIGRARDAALSELYNRALNLHADAVVGVQVTFTAIGQSNSMVLVTATGTAVRLFPTP